MTIGIDVGRPQHIASIHHDGEREARRAVLRFAADRQGLEDLQAWLSRHGEISRAVLESSGHNHLNLGAAPQRQGVPVAVVNPPPSAAIDGHKRRLVPVAFNDRASLGSGSGPSALPYGDLSALAT